MIKYLNIFYHEKLDFYTKFQKVSSKVEIVSKSLPQKLSNAEKYQNTIMGF